MAVWPSLKVVNSWARFALALHHVDGHGGLAVFEGGELLGAGSRQGAVARNDFLSQPAVGFEAE